MGHCFLDRQYILFHSFISIYLSPHSARKVMPKVLVNTLKIFRHFLPNQDFSRICLPNDLGFLGALSSKQLNQFDKVILGFYRISGFFISVIRPDIRYSAGYPVSFAGYPFFYIRYPAGYPVSFAGYSDRYPDGRISS